MKEIKDIKKITNKDIFKGNFGLERETLRVDKNRKIALTPHPFKYKYLERDFSESQLEIISPPCKSIDDMLFKMDLLDTYASDILASKGESLWKYSNPPHIDSEDEIQPAKYIGQKIEKYNYRLYLQEKYGKKVMLFSGIHFNFSFSDNYLETLFSENSSDISFTDFKNDLYLKIATYCMKYSWILVYLTASSPVFDSSLKDINSQGYEIGDEASLRNGKCGYWNKFIPFIDYNSVNSYTSSVQSYIDNKMLSSQSELYLPVRIKSKGENSLKTLKDSGIDHIELRMFDINPFEKVGISKKDLEFAHYMMIYFSLQDKFEFDENMQKNALINHKSAALLDKDNIFIDNEPIIQAANELFSGMQECFSDFDYVKEIISYQKDKLYNKRICDNICDNVRSFYYV